MENRIKECQLDLYADRTSASTMRANQLRLWFAAMAYVLLSALRRIALAGIRNTRHDIGARIRIPLTLDRPAPTQFAMISPQERRMLDGIRRDTDIITGRSIESIEDALTGTDLNRVAFANAESDITQTSARAGDNSLIVANGAFTGQQELQGNQTLLGGGATIAVRGRRTGIIDTLTAPGKTARLSAPGGNNRDDTDDNLKLHGSNTHVSGVRVVGDPEAAGDGIDLGSDKSNLFMTNIAIRNVGGDGIYARTGIKQVNISDITIMGMRGDGIDLGDDAERITIESVTIANGESDGIRFGNGGRRIEIRDSHITDVDGIGISLGADNTITILDTSISGAFAGGIQFIDNNSVTIIGGSISHVRSDGIYGEDENMVAITGLRMTDIGDDGMQFSHRNTVAITDTWILNTGGEGIKSDRHNAITTDNVIIADR